MQLLLHLQECLFEYANKCEQNLVTLDKIRSCFDSEMHPGLEAIMNALQDHAEDLRYLIGEFCKIAKDIPERYAVLKELNAMKQEHRTTIIAILVTLYVPISLACVRYAFYCCTPLQC